MIPRFSIASGDDARRNAPQAAAWRGPGAGGLEPVKNMLDARFQSVLGECPPYSPLVLLPCLPASPPRGGCNVYGKLRQNLSVSVPVSFFGRFPRRCVWVVVVVTFLQALRGRSSCPRCNRDRSSSTVSSKARAVLQRGRGRPFLAPQCQPRPWLTLLRTCGPLGQHMHFFS